jgi:hypothetical protein
MADGTTKTIKNVKVGDSVLATDPETGRTEAALVAALHRNLDTNLTDVTITVPDGATTVLHTTAEHAFWSVTRSEWVASSRLVPGERLLTSTGSSVRVDAVRSFNHAATMYNLTIDDVHTYYVISGTTPVLVHNDDGGPSSSRVPDMTGMTQAQADELLSRNGFTLTSISEGGYATYKAPDGSKVTIRLSDGRVTRTATVDPGPNQRNWTQRYGPDGQPTKSHDTGENLAC